jgi:glycyl-tRNA synthetase beta chain
VSRAPEVALEPVLIEIGCEEVPARMVPRAAVDLERALVGLLDAASLGHGATTAWGGSRRIAVRCEGVAARQPDRDETLLGPPSRAAFGADGAPTQAAIGFAAKHGIDPRALVEMRTERGTYAGIQRRVAGRTLAEILAEQLPGAVQAMSFPKTMRWADGTLRWVRPVHWLVALHGAEILPISMFGVTAGRTSAAHRFLGAGPIVLAHADEYASALERGAVIADPARRRAELASTLDASARRLGGTLVPDPVLLDEVADLLEWPGVVGGTFDRAYLDLPREILVTTLRHHQKAFAIDAPGGGLVAGFLAVANTDRDTAGHVRRGNEWVVSGRLEDARFFWTEDRKVELAARGPALAGVAFHARAGSHADKAERTATLAGALARAIGLDPRRVDRAERAARLAKNDLVTGLVGEFPELQGIAGGLLLRAEGADEEIARAVYEHYRPAGPDDPLPETEVGAVVAVADKLDTIAALLGAGERPSGSKDPFALRRAGNGILRVLLARDWPLGLDALARLAGGSDALLAFLADRRSATFRDLAFTSNEIRAALRPNVDAAALGWAAGDVRARLDALARVRGREDFRKLVQLTDRVDHILAQAGARPAGRAYRDEAEAARSLEQRIDRATGRLRELAQARAYGAIVDELATFIDPVERFFIDCLVLDPQNPEASAHRLGLLARLRELLTQDFDIRELAGEAGRKA